MTGRTLRIIIITIITLVLADCIWAASLIYLYPKRELGREAFYGTTHTEGLKDYSLGDDGVLTVLGDDPWMSYTFDKPQNIYSVRIWVSDLGGSALRRAQVYLLPEAAVRDIEMTGEMEVDFGLGSEGRGVATLRLDLGSVAGITFSLDRVLINSRRDVLLISQLAALKALFVLILLFLLIMELKGLISLARAGSSGRPRLTRAAVGVTILLKLAVICLLYSELTAYGEDPASSIAAWILIMGLAAYGAMCILLGARIRKGGLIAGYIPAIPLALIIYGLSETLSTYSFNYGSIRYFVLGLILSFLIPAVIYTVLRRAALSYAIAAVIIMILSVADYYYMGLRAAPLEYFDIRLIGTAMNVIDNYSLTPDCLSIAAFAAAGSVVIESYLCMGSGSVRERIWVKGRGLSPGALAGYAAGIAIAAAAVLVFRAAIPTEYMSTLLLASRDEGYLLHFVSLMKMGHIDEPEGYSNDRVRGILDAAARSGEDDMRTPDIIVIMDESFADLPEIYGFQTDADALAYYHSLKEDTVSGYLLTSAYGGGTVLTEYEFLTGNSLYFFPSGTSPFVQYLKDGRTSIATRLICRGYTAIAYHPYMRSSYNRGEGYEKLGFERFYSLSDELPYNGLIRDYVSDEADFDNIIYLYETRDESRPFFIFNVTMQNHGGYYTTGEEEVLISPSDERLKADELIGYLSLIRETDKALNELIEYLRGVERDVIVLFFGDHQPTESVDMMPDGENEDSRFVPGMRNAYSSFLIWANYDIPEGEGIVTSPNYLRAMLLSLAGLTPDAYEGFLLDAREEVPAISAAGRVDTDGVWYYRGKDETRTMDEYRYLVYANAFDKAYTSGSDEAGYFE